VHSPKKAQNSVSDTADATQQSTPDSDTMSSLKKADHENGDDQFVIADQCSPAGSSVTKTEGNGSDQAAEAEPAKKPPLKQRIIKEVIEVGIVIAYLAVCFSILETFRCATLLVKCSENDFLAGYATAAISAVMLGKFVFILERMRISKRFGDRPLIVPVFYRSALFTVLINFILNAEDRMLHRPPAEYMSLHDPFKYWACLLSHQLAFFVVFFIFFCFRELGSVLGEGKLFRLFFVSRKG